MVYSNMRSKLLGVRRIVLVFVFFMRLVWYVHTRRTLDEAKQGRGVVSCTTFSYWGACWSKVLVLIWYHMYVREDCYFWFFKEMFHFFSRYLVVGSRCDFFFGFNNMRRNTCRSGFVRYQAKTWKQPCVAFGGQGHDATVRQIASRNDYYGYTIVNCVWPQYSSIPQLACVLCNKLTTDAGWRRIYICVGQITIYLICRSSRYLTCRSEVLCRVCILQIQPRQHAVEHAVCVAPIPQRELDHTDQGYICPARASSCSGNR